MLDGEVEDHAGLATHEPGRRRAVADEDGERRPGAAVEEGGDLVAARQWYAVGGAPLAAALTVGYWTAMGMSHPLAKKVGTWPSVLGVTAVSAGAAWVLADRRR